jgi:hypothetical protein
MTMQYLQKDKEMEKGKG